MSWQEQVRPLMDHLRKLSARMTWEGYVSLDLDRPNKKDIILQHWYTVSSEGTAHYYIIRIYSDGSGWDVYTPVNNSLDIQETLDLIK